MQRMIAGHDKTGDVWFAEKDGWDFLKAQTNKSHAGKSEVTSTHSSLVLPALQLLYHVLPA
jgi:hypothetical protein